MGIGLKRSEMGGDNPGAALLMKEAATLFDTENKNLGTNQSGSVVDASRSTLLSLDVDDDVLLKKFKRWQDTYATYFGKIKSRQDNNLKYWKGKSYGSSPDALREYGASDNVIFESFETLLPLATRENPEAVVEANGPQEVEEAADILGQALEEIGKHELVKMKLREGVRHWGIWLLGASKLSWDAEENCIELYSILPENLELDPHGQFEGGKFTGEWVIEHKTEIASVLVERFPEKKDVILKEAKGKEDAFLKYSEGWTNQAVFWKLGENILDKRKNLHWNWPEESQGKNYLKAPAMPFSFMWHFGYGKQPHDETSLIEQAIPLQDIVNKRIRQIDKNADDTNNGWILNNTFSEESGAKALASLRRGGAILSPTDDVRAAVMRVQAPPLATFVIEDMMDKREQVRNLFGVRGSSASGITNEQTVRGKIEIKGADADRVQPIVEQVELMSEWIYNYMAQMVYVYYTNEMLAGLVGQEKADKFFAVLTSMPFEPVIYVKPGSTIPKDPLMRRNEAVDLFTAGALDPVTLFERLDFPNPMETAQKLVAWKQGGLPPPPGTVPGMAPPAVAPPPSQSDVVKSEASALPPIPQPTLA